MFQLLMLLNCLQISITFLYINSLLVKKFLMLSFVFQYFPLGLIDAYIDLRLALHFFLIPFNIQCFGFFTIIFFLQNIYFVIHAIQFVLLFQCKVIATVYHQKLFLQLLFFFLLVVDSYLQFANLVFGLCMNKKIIKLDLNEYD